MLGLVVKAVAWPRRLAAQARLVVATRNATGPLGALPHVIRI